ncbi:MAG: low temperature requirement protein A [Ginsengibacter sp.]
MKAILQSNTWWGAPKKFSTQNKERKVSWLELFYDLVYVIAIAKITGHFSENINIGGFLDYVYFFSIIYWSWLNGSLYHDLHESEGLRTKLMTLWQIMIVAALVITIDSNPDKIIFNITIALMAMQLFITYLWWSVGYYDKSHKKLNLPYTILYVFSFILMAFSLDLDQRYLRIGMFTSLILNILPPFYSGMVLKRKNIVLNLSSTMSERLGLFAIILFGEVMAGIVTGIGQFHEFTITIWLDFGIAVILVFSLWWIFFTLISDRLCKSGIIRSSVFELLYIPTLFALGLISMAFKGIFKEYDSGSVDFISLKEILGYSICLFLFCICLLSFLLKFSSQYIHLRKKVQITLAGISVGLFILTMLNFQVGITIYLLIILMILLLTIIILNLFWFAEQTENGNAEVV